MSLSELLPSIPPPAAVFDPAIIHPAAMLSGTETVCVEECDHSKPTTIHPAAIPPVNLTLVKDGYGELILRVKEGGRFRPVTEEEYAKAYQIFKKYAPGIQEGDPLSASRIEMMRKEIRQINPNMMGTFIPRTLHDLLFIRKAIEEDIRMVTTFPADKKKHLWVTNDRNFWCTGDPKAGTLEDNPKYDWDRVHSTLPIHINSTADAEHFLPSLIKVGHRLNEAACEMLMQVDQHADHLSIDQIQRLVNEHITYLQSFHKQSASFLDENEKTYFYDIYHSLSANFSSKSEYLAVDHAAKVQIIQKAADLECQPASIGKIIAYRGTHPDRDYPESRSERGGSSKIPYAVSYGSGLFPGVVGDTGACAYNHMCYKPIAYAFVVTPSAENAKYFYTPRFTALESLFGVGEYWHYRYRVSEAEKTFEGHVCSESGAAYFKSPLSRQELMTKFDELRKHHMVILKKD